MSYNDLKEYVARQLNNFFPDNNKSSFYEYDGAFDMALQRTEYCFKDVALPAYKKNNKTYFNHLHSDQYAVFLWFLSNSIWRETADTELSNKLFYLNKALNGFSCLYDTNLPDIFLLLHNVGTVLGKAEYSNYFVVSQGCTIGAQHGKYPRLGRAVALLPNSSVIGDCIIGDRVSIGIGATIYQQNIERETVAYCGADGTLKLKHQDNCWVQNLYSIKL